MSPLHPGRQVPTRGVGYVTQGLPCGAVAEASTLVGVPGVWGHSSALGYPVEPTSDELGCVQTAPTKRGHGQVERMPHLPTTVFPEVGKDVTNSQVVYTEGQLGDFEAKEPRLVAPWWPHGHTTSCHRHLLLPSTSQFVEVTIPSQSATLHSDPHPVQKQILPSGTMDEVPVTEIQQIL